MQCGFLLIKFDFIKQKIKDKLLCMEKKEPIFTINKPKWHWIKVDSELKTKIDEKSFRISLKPTVIFQSDDLCQKEKKISQKVIVDIEKSLHYENQIGWNWHKSSNLPIISIKLEVKCEDSDNLVPIPQNLEVMPFNFQYYFCFNLFQAKIFAVKIIISTLQRDQIAYLQDVGIQGNNTIQLKGGCGYFSGLRFLSTSYNNQGVKFYLLVVVHSKKNNNKIDDIVCSVMSPPVFVDSRKSARDYQEKRFLSFVELFQPLLFSKQFNKRQNKTKPQVLTKITNNMDGLFNYLTAPNIRHKVKHPLLLSTKFSNVFKIFYNKNSFENKQLTILELIKKLQQKLIKDIGGEKKNKTIIPKNLQKSFIFSIVGQSNPHRKSKICDCLEYLDCRAVQLVQYSYHIPQYYKDISTKGSIVEAYTKHFSELQKISLKDIDIRKIREERIIEMNFKGDLNISQKKQVVKIQCKNEDSMPIRSQKSLNNENYTPPHKHLRKRSQKKTLSLKKMRISDKINTLIIQQNNEIQKYHNNGMFSPLFNQNGFNLRPQNQLNFQHNNNLGSSIGSHYIDNIYGEQFPEIKIPNCSRIGNLQIPFNDHQIIQPIGMIKNNIFQQDRQPLPFIQPIMPKIPISYQPMQIPKDMLLESMNNISSSKRTTEQKQFIKNQFIVQIEIQNNYYEQLIRQNEGMKQKIQTLFQHSLLTEHKQSQPNQILQRSPTFVNNQSNKYQTFKRKQQYLVMKQQQKVPKEELNYMMKK